MYAVYKKWNTMIISKYIYLITTDEWCHYFVSVEFCCPDLVSSYCTVSSAEKTPTKVLEIEKGKLIMLVNDFYYGKDDGDAHLNQKDKKTNTTFKCYSCLKILKSNIRYYNVFCIN